MRASRSCCRNCRADRLTAIGIGAGRRRCQASGLRRRAEHPFADRHDQAGLLEHRDELGRRHQAALADASSAAAPPRRRACRSRGRTSAGRRARTRSRSSARRSSNASCARARVRCVHLGGVELVGVAPGLLGAVHRRVGGAEQRSASSPSPGNAAMPMLAVTKVCSPSSANGCASRSSTSAPPARHRRDARGRRARWRTRRR